MKNQLFLFLRFAFGPGFIDFGAKLLPKGGCDQSALWPFIELLTPFAQQSSIKIVASVNSGSKETFAAS